MMRAGVFFVGFVVASFQLTLFSQMFDGVLRLDIFFVFLMVWSLVRHGEDSFAMAFVFGLYLSHFSDMHFGFLSLFYVVLVYIASLMKRDAFEGNFLFVFGAAMLVSFVFEILLLFSFWFSGEQFAFGIYFMQRMVMRIGIHSVLISVLYPVFAKISEQYFEKQKSLVI